MKTGLKSAMVRGVEGREVGVDRVLVALRVTESLDELASSNGDRDRTGHRTSMKMRMRMKTKRSIDRRQEMNDLKRDFLRLHLRI